MKFVKHEELKRDFPELTKNQRMLIIKEFIQDLLSQFEIAKTSSYIDIDYEDIEDSQVLASAKAIGATVVTRGQRMLNKYPDWCLSAANLLHQIDEVNESIAFLDLKSLNFRINQVESPGVLTPG